MPLFSRRVLLSGGVVASFGASASIAHQSRMPSEVSGASSILHQVFFWLKNPGSESDRDQLIGGLNSLRSIKVINYLAIGVPASTEKREVVDASYDVSELMIFGSVEDQKIYQDHALHVRFVKQHAHLWRKVLVYDSKSV